MHSIDYNDDDLVFAVRTYLSHDKHFNELGRVTTYLYDDGGKLIDCHKISFTDREVIYVEKECGWLRSMNIP